MIEPSDFDPTATASAGIAALGLPTDAAYRPGIEANLTIAYRLAAMLLSFPLPDESEPAPVFDPLVAPTVEGQP
jgi:hypothetical protein